MRHFIDEYSTRKHLFVGDFDSYYIIKNNTLEVELLNVLKVALFLYDGLVIPAAFFWQSYPMSQIMPKIQMLIENEMVLPTIRNYQVTSDIKEYFERRETDTKNLLGTFSVKRPELKAEIATKENLKDVMILQNINSYVHLQNSSIGNAFREMLEIDIVGSADVHSIHTLLITSSISLEKIVQIKSVLLKEISLSGLQRSNLVNIIVSLKLSKRLEEELCDRISWLYLSASAKAANAKLFLSKGQYLGAIKEENLFMFINTLMCLGITRQFLTSLSVKDILILKQSSEYQNFINRYRELVYDIGSEERNIETLLQKKIIKEMNRERTRLRWNRILQCVNTTSASIFVGLIINYFSNSKIMMVPAIVSLGTMGISSFMKRIDFLNEKMETKSFLEFERYIARKKYNDEVQRKIGGIW